MSSKSPDRKKAFQIATGGIVLAFEGQEFTKDLWENAVYLGTDNFVYHITVSQTAGGLRKTIAGKRAVGEYLRWVDGLFRPGALPSEANGIHYRAARKLRELI
jgi:hypothetical protein